MDESMDYIPEEGYMEEPMPDAPEASAETGSEYSPPYPEDTGEEIDKRIDDLLSQIGAGQSYGSMGDYYIPEAGCYAFPVEDVLNYFVEETERTAWTAASNGCYVPADSLDAYESYLSLGSMEETEDTEGMEGTEELPPPVTQEDLSVLEGILTGIHGQAETYYEASVLHMETQEKALSDIHYAVWELLIVDIVVCFFLALLCGAKFADIFFSRMRAG